MFDWFLNMPLKVMKFSRRKKAEKIITVVTTCTNSCFHLFTRQIIMVVTTRTISCFHLFTRQRIFLFFFSNYQLNDPALSLITKLHVFLELLPFDY